MTQPGPDNGLRHQGLEPWQGKSGQCVPLPDGRHFQDGRGRRWRLSDPRLDPERLAQLRSQLTHGWRLKAQGQREQGRALVQDAKLRLGERGDPWWQLDAPYDHTHPASYDAQQGTV